MIDEFTKEIVMKPAFDKRHADPNKNCGIHGVNLTMFLTGELGAVQFVVYTSWQLPHVQKEFDDKPLGNIPYMFHKPMAADVGYHSPKPIYDGQISLTDSCSVLDGKPCYYDGSGLHAEKMFEVLLREGSEGVWKKLEEYYNEVFKS